MVRDFDFAPVNRLSKRPGKYPEPKPTRPHITKPAQSTRPAAPKKQHIASSQSGARSTLIDYHPLSNARAADQPHPIASRSTQPQAPHRASTRTPDAPAAQRINHKRTTLPSSTSPRVPQEAKRKKRIDKKTVLSAVSVFFAIILMSSGLLFPLLQNPSVSIVLYIVVALVFRLKSRVNFSIALLLLLAIPVLLLIGQQALAETYAIFCFYFLVIGVIWATLELRNAND